MNQETVELLQGARDGGGDNGSMKWVDEPIIPKKPYLEDIQTADDTLKDDLIKAMLEMRALASNDPQMSRSTVKILLDFVEWTVTVEKRSELVFTETMAVKYILYLIQENIFYSVDREDKSLIVSFETLKEIATSIVSSSLSLKNIDFRNTTIFTKLQLLNVDLQLLRDGKFENKTNVLARVKRILLTEPADFDPNDTATQPVNHLPAEGMEDEHFDSSPPIDSSVEGDRDESNHSKDLSNVNVLTQSTQINTMNKSLDQSRVDVHATSSSNGDSQQSKDSHNGEHSRRDSLNSKSSRIKKYAKKIQDVQLRNELLQFAEELQAEDNSKVSFADAYNQTEAAFKTILQNLDAFKSVQSNIPSIQTFVEAIGLSNDTEISIRSTESSRVVSNESQEPIQPLNQEQIDQIKKDIGAEALDRKESTKVLSNYLDRRINKLSTETKTLRENLKSFNRSEIEVLNIKDLLNKLKDSSVSKLDHQAIVQNLESKINNIEDVKHQMEAGLLSVTSIGDQTSAAVKRMEALERENRKLSNQMISINNYFLKVYDAQKSNIEMIQNFHKMLDAIESRSSADSIKLEGFSADLQKIQGDIRKMNDFQGSTSKTLKSLAKQNSSGVFDFAAYKQIADKNIEDVKQQVQIIDETLQKKIDYDNKYINEKFDKVGIEIERIIANQTKLMKESKPENSSRLYQLNSSPPPMNRNQLIRQAGNSKKELSSSPELLSEKVFHQTSVPRPSLSQPQPEPQPQPQQRRAPVPLSSKGPQNTKKRIMQNSLSNSISAKITGLLQRNKKDKEPKTPPRKRSRSPSTREGSEGLKHIKLFRAIDD